MAFGDFIIAHATSSRASCQDCKEKISPNGAIRLGQESLFGPPGREYHVGHKWWCLSCGVVVKTGKLHVAAKACGGVSGIPGYESIEPSEEEEALLSQVGGNQVGGKARKIPTKKDGQNNVGRRRPQPKVKAEKPTNNEEMSSSSKRSSKSPSRSRSRSRSKPNSRSKKTPSAVTTSTTSTEKINTSKPPPTVLKAFLICFAHQQPASQSTNSSGTST
ncbi:hypothetical protein TrST_g5165 [Triparma strigata]|uniref:PARP-type domain-containing protein n=1 Tax=Triparma strigata TaxID=1606541 RepID=A0A9W7DVR1_9STRA|nr:hypothetical protein TrST_g5165 [Triparma strigata]